MICSTSTIARWLVGAVALSVAVTAQGGETAIDAARHAADAAIARRDPVSAETVVRAALAATHADAALRPWLAKSLLAEGDRDAARKVLDAGPMTADGAGLGWRIRGQIALAEGNLPAAAAAFDQALRFAPGDADLWVSIASMRFTGGEQALAVVAADHAVALDPRNPGALALRGLLIREQYGLAASLPWFEAALKLHPDEPALLEAYGATLGDMGEARPMLIVARKLAEVDPRNPRPLLMQAVLAARAGQTALARSILQRTGSAFRDMPAAMLLSGVLEFRTGNFDLAVEALDRLGRMQPDNRMARQLLVRALAAKGDWRRVTEVCEGDIASGRADPDVIALARTGWQHVAARDRGPRGTAARARVTALTAQLRAITATRGAAALPGQGTLAVLATHYADNPRAARNAVPYIRALLAAHQADAAQPVADRLRDENTGNAEAQMLAGDVRTMRGDARAALIDYTNAAAIRFNEAVLVRMDAALRASGRTPDADAMTSRYLAQNPESATAMTLLAAGWAGNPARARDLNALQKAMLARELALPQIARSPSTSAAKTG
ncbi:tetratricopeptide repeat protein [Novosphingobium sp.]|uniref:tetratricopeptide repeat protein n=1 Tax=Novosphingobium sp. TaxID=1874826 RepID=UPI003341B36D